jgi:polyhydroxyalkanoate synthesis regulator phasin
MPADDPATQREDLLREIQTVRAGWQRKLPPELRGETEAEMRPLFLEEQRSLIESAVKRGDITPQDGRAQLAELMRFDTSALVDPMRTDLEEDLQDILDNIASVARNSNPRSSLGDIAVGCLPTGNVNAVTTIASSSPENAVILLDVGMPLAVNLAAKAAARSYPSFINERNNREYSTDVDRIEQEISDNPKMTVQPYGELLHAYLVDGHPAFAPRYVLPEPWVAVSNTLRGTAETFVLAHEFAHFQNGDLAFPALSEIEGDQTMLALCQFFMADLEIKADSAAARLAVDVGGRAGVPPSRALLGAVLWFKTAEIFEIGLHALACQSVQHGMAAVAGKYETSGQGGADHPSFKRRLENLLNWQQLWDMLASTPDSERQWLQVQAADNLRAIAEIMELLNGFALTAFEGMIGRGMQLHPRWMPYAAAI